MRKAKENAARKCPVCGKVENQVNAGRIVRERKDASARSAENTTPLNRKHESILRKFVKWQLKPTTPEQAGEVLVRYSASAKLMFITGLKKTAPTPKANSKTLELGELYWFVGQKSTKETRENAYIMTMVSRAPRQIVRFDVAFDKSALRIQRIVDSGPEADFYCTDGYLGYVDVVYPGKHIRNVNNKNDTYTAEGINADLRHYIPILRRRSRCFPRKLETLQAVLELFVQAYNEFGIAKENYRSRLMSDSRELPFSVLDFL